jgi:hypothetical protein
MPNVPEIESILTFYGVENTTTRNLIANAILNFIEDEETDTTTTTNEGQDDG